MTELTLRVHLLSDAEPGSGLATELVNSLVPRNARAEPCIPASHLKGLLRDKLGELVRLRGWPHVDAELLGARAVEGDDGQLARASLSDAVADAGELRTFTVTRTALGPLGTVDSKTLRTTEALPAGATLRATARVEASPGDVLDQALRLGLMSIEALGGGRSRGSGRCRIEIVGETRDPGELLRQLDTALASWQPAARRERIHAKPAHSMSAGAAVWCRLVFEADTPICCPELPLVSNNAIRSGPAIPSSAVQGALLTRLDRVDPALATACLHDPRFRAWPLLPSAYRDDWSAGDALPPMAIRVDLAHRMSKEAGANGHEFRDAAVAPYHWSEVAAGTPLRSNDGVLRRWPDGRVDLWRAQDLPRLVSAHAAIDTPDGSRGLYTIEALAPLVFTGLVALPPEAAEALDRALQADPILHVGKARSVRGRGRLHVHRLTDAESTLTWALPGEAAGRVFIAQSPLALPDDWDIGRAETALQRLVDEAGWGRLVLDEDVGAGAVARTMAACAVRFGWNRHGVGSTATPAHSRLRARRVILPGSVLVLTKPLDRVLERLLTGLGDGREQGFGALLPHPGIATGRVERQQVPPTLTSRSAASREGLSLWRASEQQGPTPSQIAALLRHLDTGPAAAVAFLERQRKERPPRVWHRWEGIADKLKGLVQGDVETARGALRVWQDLAIVHREEQR